MTTAKPLARYSAIGGRARERLRYHRATPLQGTRPVRPLNQEFSLVHQSISDRSRARPNVRFGSRLCENSDAELARRISISISSPRETSRTGRPHWQRAIEKTILSVLGSRCVFTQPGSKTEVAALRRDVCFTPESGHWTDIPVGPFSANRRHRARTPLDNFLSEDFAFTRKGQSEHDFSYWRARRPPSTPCLRT